MTNPAPDPRLLELVRCPACRATLESRGGEELACVGCGLVYPVVNGVPILLVDDARRPDAG